MKDGAGEIGFEGSESVSSDPGAAAAAVLALDAEHRFAGTANVVRVARWGFPAYEVRHSTGTLALLGRGGWFRIYLGPGRRVELPDGDAWRIRSARSRGAMRPVIIDGFGRRVAEAGAAHGTYGINGKDYACVLYPADKPRLGRANRWILRQFENELAVITRHPPSVDASLAVHLGAVLLSMVVIQHGLPEESTPAVPAFRWGAR